jgi:hypothetical protein
MTAARPHRPTVAVLIHGPGAGTNVEIPPSSRVLFYDPDADALSTYELRVVDFQMILPENHDVRRRWRWVVGVLDDATYDDYVQVCRFVFTFTGQFPAQHVRCWEEDWPRLPALA